MVASRAHSGSKGCQSAKASIGPKNQMTAASAARPSIASRTGWKRMPNIFFMPTSS